MPESEDSRIVQPQALVVRPTVTQCRSHPLSILELSAAGRQPMLSASRRFVIAFNGEIYNHIDLRATLDAEQRVAWHGNSDTETLLAAVERWGVKAALERSVGMFAIVLWDTRTRTLTLARDRMGEKPLYYGRSRGAFPATRASIRAINETVNASLPRRIKRRQFRRRTPP
jgi:asparagine synthetase B (glutamine-hydrolysing)